MTDTAHRPLTFTGVSVYRRNHVWIRSVDDEFAEETTDHTVMLRWLEGTWGRKSIGRAVRATCFPQDPSLAIANLAVDGNVVLFTLPGERTEVVDASDDGLNDRLNARDMRLIGTRLYVVGLARRAYRREAPSRWMAVDRGVFVPRVVRHDVCGFNSLDGLDERNVYAVGYNGEIWFYDGRQWEPQQSLTTVVLNVVRCLSIDDVYVCGMSGTLIRGRRGQWRLLAHGATKADFWGMAVFREKVYVANYDGLFVVEGDRLAPVNMRLAKTVTTAYLDAADGVLWSVGQKDAAFTDDGSNWTLVEPP